VTTTTRKRKAKHVCCCEDARLIVMSGPAHFSAEEAMRLLGIEPGKRDLLVYAGHGSLQLADIKQMRICTRT
jgi:glutamate/tyrosine decarboxylase-like PLP-dependent enzyme